MFGITFRDVRAVLLISEALASITVTTFSLAIREHLSHTTDICILIIIPFVCLVSALALLFHNRIFANSYTKSVTAEVMWTGVIAPLSLVMCLYTYTLSPAPAYASVFWPFAVLRALAWTLALLVTFHGLGVLVLGVLTATTADRDVWVRPISGSPSPFPLALIAHTLFAKIHPSPKEAAPRSIPHLCLSGCTCAEKLPASVSLPRDRLSEAGRQSSGSRESSVVPGIRLPNAAERHAAIFVGFMSADMGA